MITDTDIKKMKKVFATKDDLTGLAKQKDLLRVEAKVDNVDKRVVSMKKKVDELTEYIVPTVGNILEWTDDIHRAIVGRSSKRLHGN